MMDLTSAADDVARTQAWLAFTEDTERLARLDELVWQQPAAACAHPWRCRLARFARSVTRKARQLWDGCPGPWPVKVILVALAVAEPGPFGELALISLSAANAARKARKAAGQ